MKKRKMKLLTSLLVLITSLGLVAGATYCWFVTRTSGGVGSILTGDTPIVDTHLITYNLDKSLWEKYDATPGEKTNPYDDYCQGFEECEIETTDYKTTFNLKSINLGNIDNLVDLKEENKLYFQFDLNKEKNGTKSIFTYNMYRDDDSISFTLYQINDDGNGMTLIENDDSRLDETNQEIVKYNIFKLSYYVSYEGEKSGEELNTIEFDEIESVTREAQRYNTTRVIYFYDDTKDVEDYYLYIKIEPNTESLSNLAYALREVMPCVILWNCEISIEVY